MTNPHRHSERLERELAGKPRTRRPELEQAIKHIRDLSRKDEILEVMNATFEAVRQPCVGEKMREQRAVAGEFQEKS